MMAPVHGTYVPTLAIRASEMNGLEFLPGISKDRMVPVFLLAPWANSKRLARAIERVERAFPGRRYFLDFDRDYIPTDVGSPAQAEWLDLRYSSDEFRSWGEFWVEWPMAIPSLQLDGQGRREIIRQVEGIQSHGREFCLRVELRRMPQNLRLVLETLTEIGTADYTVIVEGGWARDSLSMYAYFYGLITDTLAALDSRVPIVASSTSIPRGFSDMEGLVEVPFSNHDLVDQLRRYANREVILYGDWASTKPRDDDFGRRPFPRIDYPTSRSWYFARHREMDWDFRSAAMAVVESSGWNGNLGIWGEEMIRDTTINQEFAIDTPQKNVAARVNIHLHLQALQGMEISGMDLEDDWVD